MADSPSEPEAEAGGPVTGSESEVLSRTEFAGTSWIILGAGGHARSVADVVARLGGRVVAVVGRADRVWNVPVISTDDEAMDLVRQGHFVALGIGANQLRAKVLGRFRALGIPMPPIVAATATVAEDSTLGRGTVVLEHAHVGPSSHLGAGVIVNTGAIIEHDCLVAAAVHLAPRSTTLGGVRVGESALIGANACILPGLAVGAGTIVGSGAIVRRDVSAGLTVVGVPARTVNRSPTTKEF